VGYGASLSCLGASSWSSDSSQSYLGVFRGKLWCSVFSSILFLISVRAVVASFIKRDESLFQEKKRFTRHPN
jgi:hypothetical protein